MPPRPRTCSPLLFPVVQRTRTLPDYATQRASFFAWLLLRHTGIRCGAVCMCTACHCPPRSARTSYHRRRSTLLRLCCRRLSLNAERWEDDSAATALRLAVAGEWWQ